MVWEQREFGSTFNSASHIMLKYRKKPWRVKVIIFKERYFSNSQISPSINYSYSTRNSARSTFWLNTWFVPSLFKKEVDRKTEDISSVYGLISTMPPNYLLFWIYLFTFTCIWGTYEVMEKKTLIFLFTFCYILITHIIKYKCVSCLLFQPKTCCISITFNSLTVCHLSFLSNSLYSQLALFLCLIYLFVWSQLYEFH